MGEMGWKPPGEGKRIEEIGWRRRRRRVTFKSEVLKLLNLITPYIPVGCDGAESPRKKKKIIQALATK